MVGHAADEPEAACVVRNLIRTCGIIQLVRSLDDCGVAVLKGGQ